MELGVYKWTRLRFLNVLFVAWSVEWWVSLIAVWVLVRQTSHERAYAVVWIKSLEPWDFSRDIMPQPEDARRGDYRHCKGGGASFGGWGVSAKGATAHRLTAH